MTENKTYSKLKGKQWWVVIDCGETKSGGYTVGNFWNTHFKHEGKTFRWYQPIFNYQNHDLKEWQEIKVTDLNVTMITPDKGVIFEGWQDGENLAYSTLAKFARLLNKKLTIQQVKDLIK